MQIRKSVILALRMLLWKGTMEKNSRLHPLVLIQSALLLLLLGVLLAFGKGQNLVYGGASLALLIVYHLVIDYRITTERLASSGLMNAYVIIYLLLCTFVVMTTVGDEESPFWIVYFLPIVIAAANLNLRGTMLTSSAALVLYIFHLPPKMYHDPKIRVEGLPEFIGFGVMFFLVGALVQTFAQQNRRQLALKQQLNEKLLENQQHLKDSLERLSAAEESLRTKERLASLGAMSAGIAHEIRNPLGIISSSAQLLDREIANADARQLLDIIQEESSRLNGLITDFLTFGRQLEPHRQPCELAGLVMRCLDSLRSTAEQKGVTIAFDNRCGRCEANVDTDMIQQVLLNLMLNALDATPGGGRVDVSLGMQASHIDIVVRDSGCGIPTENLGRIFDPFFTTKGNGTGLGLANTYKIMQSHGGTLQVNSRVGTGSTFTASLPIEVI
jgi:signal transduction histidine kinase